MKNKKGQGVLNGLSALIIPLVAVGIALVVGFLIIAEVKTQPAVVNEVGQFALNASNEVSGALDDIPGWLPIIVITVIGALLIGLVKIFRA